MDFSNYKVEADNDGRVNLKAGRYVLHFQGEKQLTSENNPNWEGYSAKFEVEDTGQTVDALFTTRHQEEKHAQNGLKSLLAMCKAMGLKELPSDTESAFMGKSVSAVIRQKPNSVYFEVDQDWGRTWEATDKKQKTVSEKPIEASPSAADLEKMGSTTLDDEEAPF